MENFPHPIATRIIRIESFVSVPLLYGAFTMLFKTLYPYFEKKNPKFYILKSEKFSEFWKIY